MAAYGFTTEIRVRFAETDAQGIAHHAAYLAHHAGGYQALRDQGIEALVTEAHVCYGVPARFDDVVRISARCLDVRGARFRYEYLLERADDRIADGWTSHACVDARTLRPTRVPEWLRAAIATAEVKAEAKAAEA